MSEDVRNSELAEDIATDAVVQEESQEGIVDNENLNEEADENLEEAAAKKEMHDEEEEEETEGKIKEEAPQVTIPKTKAGTIQAAVEMLKKARKEDAQKLFAKMIKVDETSEEDSIKSADDAMKKSQESKRSKSR